MDVVDLDAALGLRLFCSKLGGLNPRLAALEVMVLKSVGDFAPTAAAAAEVLFTGPRAAAAGKEPARLTAKLCAASAKTEKDRFLLGS